MRKIAMGLILGLCLTVLTGCPWLDRNNQEITRFPTKPTAASLIEYQNKNARKVRSLQATNVTMTVKPPDSFQTYTLTGADVFVEKPRNFRMLGRLLHSPGVDIGSNNNEFWYWINHGEVKDKVFHCSYDSLARGVQASIPVHPDTILTALGIAEQTFDPNKKYEVKDTGKTFELIEPSVSPQGQPIQKVTVFRKGSIRGDAPRITSYIIRDQRGNEISRANISLTQTQKTPTNQSVVLPRRVTVTSAVGKGKKVEVVMTLNGVKIVNFSKQRAASLFSRDLLSERLNSFNLATGEVIPANQFRRANGNVPRGNQPGGDLFPN